MHCAGLPTTFVHSGRGKCCQRGVCDVTLHVATGLVLSLFGLSSLYSNLKIMLTSTILHDSKIFRPSVSFDFHDHVTYDTHRHLKLIMLMKEKLIISM